MLGFIYKIEYIENPDIFYIGSTKQKLSRRMSKHRSNYKEWVKGTYGKCMIYELFKQYGVEKFKIVELERVEVEDRQELLKYEDKWICSTDCINKYRAFTGLNRKQYKKEYYEKNKNKNKEQMKQYYIDNNEKRKKYQKEYSEKNKNKIKEYQNKRVNCGHCNKELNKSSLKLHIKRKH